MQRQIKVSVPVRIDMGGTWDLKAFALLFRDRNPATVNIALNLPITMTLEGCQDELVIIRDEYGLVETRLGNADLNSRFGLLLALCTYFGWEGFSLDIHYTVPPGNGLGGSGAMGAGFIAGMAVLNRERMSNRQIALAVHDVEESLRFSYCGLQDQCAAIYGGVHKWLWDYGSRLKYTGRSLVGSGAYHEISDRLIVAYLGRPHQADINQRQKEALFDPETRFVWFRINEITSVAAKCLAAGNWEALARCVREENHLRLTLVPDRATAEGKELMAVANELGAGFAVAGAGAGGCVFAFCPDERKLPDLEAQWKNRLAGVDGAMVFCRPRIGEPLEVRVITDGRENSENRRLDARNRASVAL